MASLKKASWQAPFSVWFTGFFNATNTNSPLRVISPICSPSQPPYWTTCSTAGSWLPCYTWLSMTTKSSTTTLSRNATTLKNSCPNKQLLRQDRPFRRLWCKNSHDWCMLDRLLAVYRRIFNVSTLNFQQTLRSWIGSDEPDHSREQGRWRVGAADLLRPSAPCSSGSPQNQRWNVRTGQSTEIASKTEGTWIVR